MSGQLEHAPARIIQQLMIDLALATDPADDEEWPIFFSHRPDTPNECMVVYDTDFKKQGRNMITGDTEGQYGIQLAIRSNSVNGYVKGREMLHGWDGVVYRNTVTVPADDESGAPEATYLVQAINRTSDVISLGKEVGSSRRLYTINATVGLYMIESGDTGTGTGTGT